MTALSGFPCLLLQEGKSRSAPFTMLLNSKGPDAHANPKKGLVMCLWGCWSGQDESLLSQRKEMVKAQEGKRNSWTGTATPAQGLQGCYTSPTASHVLFCEDIHTPWVASRMVGSSPEPGLELPKGG